MFSLNYGLTVGQLKSAGLKSVVLCAVDCNNVKRLNNLEKSCLKVNLKSGNIKGFLRRKALVTIRHF